MSPQFSIVHYQVTSRLGQGGMGEVWRATDTRLNRDVPIKIFSDAFAHDADRNTQVGTSVFGREFTMSPEGRFAIIPSREAPAESGTVHVTFVSTR